MEYDITMAEAARQGRISKAQAALLAACLELVEWDTRFRSGDSPDSLQTREEITISIIDATRTVTEAQK